MYKIQKSPDRRADLAPNGPTVTPLVTLKDEYGGIAHIIIDDHCYMLITGSRGNNFVRSYHWFAEAIKALKRLPAPV